MSAIWRIADSNRTSLQVRNSSHKRKPLVSGVCAANLNLGRRSSADFKSARQHRIHVNLVPALNPAQNRAHNVASHPLAGEIGRDGGCHVDGMDKHGHRVPHNTGRGLDIINLNFTALFCISQDAADQRSHSFRVRRYDLRPLLHDPAVDRP